MWEFSANEALQGRFLPVKTGEATELWTARKAGLHWSWKVIQWDGAGFAEKFVAPYYPNSPGFEVLGLHLGRDTAGSKVVFIALSDGKIDLHDPQNYRLLRSIQLTPAPAKIEALAIGDMDADGSSEIVVSSSRGLSVFNSDGLIQWTLASVSGNSVVLGNVDTDGSQEIILSKRYSAGWVIDAVTHKAEWKYSDSFGGDLLLANADDDPALEIIGDLGSQFGVFDVSSKSLLFKEATSGSLAVGNLDDDPDDELVTGYLKAYDLRRRRQIFDLFDYNSPGEAPLLVTDVDDDNSPDIICNGWLRIWKPDRRAYRWKNAIPIGGFVSSQTADIDGDGEQEILVCASTGDDFDTPNVLLSFDPETRLMKTSPLRLPEEFHVSSIVPRDIEGDSRPEILVCGSFYDSGGAYAYAYDQGKFRLIWEFDNLQRNQFPIQIDAADLSGDGRKEIVTLMRADRQNKIAAFDLKSGERLWTSPVPIDRTGLIIRDLDDDPAREIVTFGGGISILDTNSMLTESLPEENYSYSVNDPDRKAILAGDTDGAVWRIRFENGSYKRALLLQSGKHPIISLLPVSSNSLFVSTNMRVEHWTGSPLFKDWSTIRQGDPGYDAGPEWLAAVEKGNKSILFASGEQTWRKDFFRAFELRTTLERPILSLSSEFKALAEGESSMLRVSRSGNLDAPVNVGLTWSGEAEIGHDLAAPLTIHLKAGETLKSIPVKALSDRVAESTESGTVELRALEVAQVLGAPVAFEIRDAAPTITLSGLQGNTISEGAGEVEFVRIDLSKPAQLSMVVHLAIAGVAESASDFSFPTTVVIPAGSVSQTVKLKINDDTNFEAKESLQVRLAQGAAYHLSEQRNVEIAIVDNEPILSVTSPAREIEEPSKAYSVVVDFQVLREGPLDQPCSFAYAMEGSATSGEDYVAPSGPAVIPAGASQVTIPISIRHDMLSEVTENLILKILPDAGYGLRTAQAEMSILGLENQVSIRSVDETVKEGKSARFLLQRSGASVDPLQVGLRFSGTSTFSADYRCPKSVLFSPGESSKIVTLQTRKDTLAEGTETIRVSLIPGPYAPGDSEECNILILSVP